MPHHHIHQSNKSSLYTNITRTTLINQVGQSGSSSSSQDRPPPLRHQKSKTQETVKIPVETKSTRWYRVMTTLHPYPLEGPHYLTETSDEWYCDNTKCKFTIYGKYANYSLPCWRSAELGPGFVLCDKCVKEYSAARKARTSAPAQLNITVQVNPKTNTASVIHASQINTSGVSSNVNIQPKINVVTTVVKDDEEEKEGVVTTTNNNNNNNNNNNKQLVGPTKKEMVEEKKEQVSSVPQVLKQGWLLKQGSKLKTWKQRFCMLQSDGKLYYFENDKSKYYKGLIDLQKCQKVRCGKKSDFDIVTDDRTWKFVCKKLETRDDWVAIICEITGCTIEND